MKVRLDKWLWAARFYKTRSLATAAVSAGHVQLDGERVKPAKVVMVGQLVLIRKEAQRREVRVVALSQQRGPAVVAQTLYQETEASLQAGELSQDQRSLERQIQRGIAGDGRPDKRQRRLRVAAKDALGAEPKAP